MTNIIFYYTGTGNSRHAANRAAEALGGATLIHMGRKRDEGYKALFADAVGFVFPVYAWGPPLAVKMRPAVCAPHPERTQSCKTRRDLLRAERRSIPCTA